jgi:hypothetical protein
MSGAKVTVTVRSLPDVGTVLVTGKGYALYMFEAATGQAIDLNGGPWYVLRPSGAPLDTGP